MKLPPILACAVCMALFACDQDAVAPLQPTSTGTDEIELTSSKAQNNKARKFAASLTYDGYMMGDRENCVVLRDADDVQSVQLSVDGRANQMGRVTGTIDGCKQMPYFYGLTDVTGTIAASNGNEVWFKCERLGHWYMNEELNTAVYRGNAVIVGGVGRFEGASGDIMLLLTQEMSQPEGSLIGEAELDGTIVY